MAISTNNNSTQSNTKPTTGGDFKITEISNSPQKTSGKYETKPLTQPIVWTATGYSKPQDTWNIKKHLRTVRNDYAFEPVEQVLGVIFEPFTLHGHWDNKYNGGADNDFAWNTKITIEQLHDRANLCEFSFDDISITGLIVNVEFDYVRRSYIKYSLTISPHYDKKASVTNKKKTTPDVFDQQVSHKVNEAQTTHINAPQEYMIQGTAANISGYLSSPSQISLSLYDQVTQYLNLWQASSANISTIISNRALTSGPLNVISSFATSTSSVLGNQTGIQRLAQEFVALAAVSIQMLEYLKSASPTYDLTYQDGTNIMNYLDYINNIKLNAREMIEIAFNAQQELNRYIQNDVLTIYRPAYMESMEEIAIKFYGSPSMWRLIASQNNLTTLILQGDEILLIPKAGQ